MRKTAAFLATLGTVIGLVVGAAGAAVAQEESDSLADHPLTGPTPGS
jgi:hypothetical protein